MAELPAWFAELRLRWRVEALGPLRIDAVPDALQRAATVTGLIAQPSGPSRRLAMVFASAEIQFGPGARAGRPVRPGAVWRRRG